MDAGAAHTPFRGSKLTQVRMHRALSLPLDRPGPARPRCGLRRLEEILRVRFPLIGSTPRGIDTLNCTMRGCRGSQLSLPHATRHHAGLFP